MAQRLGEAWGRNVVVDNRPGASGMIGTEIVTKADARWPRAPRPHLLLSGHRLGAREAAVRPGARDRPGRDDRARADADRRPSFSAGKEREGADRRREDARRAGSTTARPGTGGNNHFSGSLFAAAAGIKMTHVPYKGISLAVTALASGEIEIVISSQAALAPQVKAGRVRILGGHEREALPALPGLPAGGRRPARRDTAMSCGGASSPRRACRPNVSPSSTRRPTRYSRAPI